MPPATTLFLALVIEQMLDGILLVFKGRYFRFNVVPLGIDRIISVRLLGAGPKRNNLLAVQQLSLQEITKRVRDIQIDFVCFVGVIPGNINP